MTAMDPKERAAILARAQAVLDSLEEPYRRTERVYVDIAAPFPRQPWKFDLRKEFVKIVGAVIVAKRKSSKWFRSLREDISEHVRKNESEDPK